MFKALWAAIFGKRNQPTQLNLTSPPRSAGTSQQSPIAPVAYAHGSTAKKEISIGREGAWAFSPDSRFVAYSDNDLKIRILEFETRLEHEPIAGPIAKSIVFSADGKLLITHTRDSGATKSGTIQVWDIASRTEISRVSVPDLTDRRSLMAVPNSTNLMVYKPRMTVILRIPELDENTAFRPNPIFSPDGQSYLSGDRVFSTNTHQLLSTLAEEGAKGFAVDGSRIFSVNDPTLQNVISNRVSTGVKNNRTIKLWDFGTWRLLQTIVIGGSRQWPYGGYALSPAGALFADADSGTIRLWDVATGEQSNALQHPGGISDINFSPDGRIIATDHGSRLGLAWDSRTGRLLARYEIPAPGGVWITFFPDGRYMAVTKYKGGGDFVNLELVDVEHFFVRSVRR